MQEFVNISLNSADIKNSFSNRSTILVVDEDPLFLKLLSQIISSENCDIIEASNTEEALDKVKGKKTDLVITEFMLKTKSSIELFSLIRKNNPFVPIVVITRYPELISENDIRMFGGNQLMTKPLETLKLRRIIRKYCNQLNIIS